jgi:hypothetical protein
VENEKVEETQGEEQKTTPEVSVTTNGTTTTATVETVDSLADPKDPEGFTGEDKKQEETPKAEQSTLEDDMNNQKKAEEELKVDLKDKGVDFDALADEYSNNGSLSEKSMESLKKAGYPESVVNAYLNGLQALSDRFTSTVKGYAGGEEGYDKLVEFLKTQPKEVVDAYNKTIQTGDLGQIRLTIDGLTSKMTKAYGTANPTVMGNGSVHANAEGYTSMEQMTKDMSDSRYQVDPKFTREVYQKIRNATIF